MKEIKEPEKKHRLVNVGIPRLLPVISSGFCIIVRLAGTAWEKWYCPKDQADYEEVLASAHSVGVRDHDIHLYATPV